MPATTSCASQPGCSRHRHQASKSTSKPLRRSRPRAPMNATCGRSGCSPNAQPRVGSLDGPGGAESLGIDPVVDRPHSRGVNRDAFDQAILHQFRVGDDQAQPADGLPFPMLIASPFPSHPLAMWQRRGPALGYRRIVDVVDPVDIVPDAVAAVHDDGPAGPRDLRGDLPPRAVQERRAERGTAERPRHAMPDDLRMLRQGAGDAMAHQMDLGPSMLRQVPGELIIGPIHPAPGDEVGRDDHIGLLHR